jgi:hypothetical protein
MVKLHTSHSLEENLMINKYWDEESGIWPARVHECFDILDKGNYQHFF